MSTTLIRPTVDANTILQFWFNELKQKDWFDADTKLDNLIRERFLDIYQKASAGELYTWRETDEGRLAEIIILDQFSRNIFRGHKKAYATDDMALVLAQEAIANEADKSLSPEHKAFMYMPFMHSESKAIHEIAVKLFSQPGLESNLDYEMKHKSIIDRFGKFPHRNKILDRESSMAEIEFLKEPGSSF